MRYIMALLLSLALAVPAFAGFEGPNASTGGFAGPGPQTITKAAQVQNALDDTTCTLEGNILERLSKNKYVFQDDSGKISKPYLTGNLSSSFKIYFAVSLFCFFPAGDAGEADGRSGSQEARARQ